MSSLVNTAPPGLVINLHTTNISNNSVSLSWTRPEVTGRDDFYYSIEYSDPNTGSFILSNGSYVNSALTVSYTVPNLRPNTPYTIRVTTHNGVSDQDTENEALRRVDLPIRTGEGGKRNNVWKTFYSRLFHSIHALLMTLQFQVSHKMCKFSQELLCGDPQLSLMELLLATS